MVPVIPPTYPAEREEGGLDVLKKLIRVLLTVISILILILFLVSLYMGANFFFNTPYNMELVQVESPCPYPASPPWEEEIAVRVPWARIWFIDVMLEEGDVLVVTDLNTGSTWTYDTNGTDVLTSVFYAGGDGCVRLKISIQDDGDSITSMGAFGFVVTDIWSLVLRPYILILAYAILLPSTPAWVLAAVLQGIFITCFIVSAISSGGYHRALINSYGKPLKKAMSNFLYAFPFISTASLTGWFILNFLVNMAGIGTGVKGKLPGPIFMLLEASYAAVVEELFFRLLLIGLPMGIAAMLARGAKSSPWGTYAMKEEPSSLSLFLKGLFCPGALSKDVRKRLRPLTWLLVIASSLAFGLAHVAAGTWEPGKAITAAAIGLVLGACFTSYGIYASILLHWFFNYHIQVWSVWIQRAPYDILAYLTAGLVILSEMAIGGLSLIMFLIQGIRMLLRRRRPSYIQPAAPAYQPVVPPAPSWALEGQLGGERVE